jgi:hypothetical protein
MTARLVLVALLSAAAARAQEESPYTLRVYDVGALVPPSPGPLQLRGQEPEFGLLGPGPFHAGYAEAAWLEHESANRTQVAQAMQQFLTGMAEGAQIQTNGEEGELLVEATAEDHARIARVLELLTAQAGTPFRIEVRHVSLPGGAVDDGVRSLIHAVAAGTATDADLARLLRLDARAGSRCGTVSAVHGSWTVWRSVRRLVYVPDFDVEIAQGSAICDPISVPAADGLQAAVRPFLLQDGSVLLRVVASAGDFDETFRRLRVGTTDLAWLHRATHSLGELEQADYRGTAAATELVLAPGATRGVLVGSPTLARRTRWDMLLFTVREAPAPVPAGTFCVLPVGALCAPDLERVLAWTGDDEKERYRELCLSHGEGNNRVRLGIDWIRDRFTASGVNLDELGWLHGGTLIVRAEEASARRVQERLAELERLYLRPAAAVLEVRAADGALAAAFRAPLLMGRRASVAGYFRRDLVEDYDVEVAQESRISDPVPRTAYAGLFANVDLSAGPSGSHRLRLELRISTFTGEIVEETPSPEFGPVQKLPTWTQAANLTVDLPRGARKSFDIGDGFTAILSAE